MPEKYQKEIEALLENVSDFPRKKRGELRVRFRSICAIIPSFLVNKFSVTSTKRLILGIVILLLIAWWLTTMLPGYLGIVIWIIAILLAIGLGQIYTNEETTYEKRWRGTVIGQPTPRNWMKFTRRTKEK
jgi:hypothetical protein